MDELPEHIGPYEVRDRLGQGGMGVVYLGFDPMLDRPVAIKVLKVPDEETRRRFLREARLAARVHHPHIVSIYAVGEHAGNPYLAMEFIAGRTLSQIIRGGDPVPLARKVQWLSELCAGLGHAHQSGIVHRDVKPSNLLIAQGSGTLRLVDFGIAHGNEASGMTMAGMVVGTPQYMSPEQITGQAVDARSDIFSVGAVAYELLTGRQAFAGDNLYQVSRQIVAEQPRPLESFVPDIPPALARVVAWCLQKDPAQRAESARVLEREFLALARRLDPEHTLAVVAPPAPTVAPPRKDITTSQRELLREADEAIARGQFTVASGLLEKLEGVAPTAEVQQLRQRLQTRRLEARLQDAHARAQEALQTGSIEEAEAAISLLAEIAPRHGDLERFRTALQGRVDERQVVNLTSRARLALQQGRLDEAEALVAEALALDPDATQAMAVQQKLQERTRAQRIARLVAQASRALDQEDRLAARRAIDALVKLDPAHRDVGRLQARLLALSDDEAHAAAPAGTDARHSPPSPPGSGPAAAARPPRAATAAAGLGSVAPPPVAAVGHPAPLRFPVAAGRPSGQRPGAAALPTPAGSAPAPADAVLMRSPPVAGPETDIPAAVAPEPPPARGAGSARWLLPAVVALLLLAAGGYVLSRALRPGQTDGQSAPQTAGTAAAGPAAGATSPGAAAAARSANVTPATTPVTSGVVAPLTTSPTSIPEAPPAAPDADPWASVRRDSLQGRFDRALAAIDQVQGVPAALLLEERSRVAEAARRQALAARRGAEDMRLTASAQYVLGTSQQAEADRQRSAGRLKAAVSGYMAARAHYLRAFADNGKAAPLEALTVPTGGPPPGAAVTTQAAADAPAAPVAPSTTAAVTAPRVDLSTWSNEEARAAVAQFCAAYLARDLEGLTRLWPNISPEWRAELRDAFGMGGELVCVFENVTIVRASDEFSATARLLTQLPGGEQRRRGLALSLVPSRDRLIIGNMRVR